MSDVTLTARQRRRSLSAVIASMTVQALIFGLSMPLLALALEARGIDKLTIGLSAGAQAVAVLTIAPFAARLISALGLPRLMIGSTLLSVVVFLLLPVFPDIYAWFILRFLLGLFGSIVWIAGEAWINQIAEDRSRGRVIALYSAALAAGNGIGPFVLAQTGTAGWLPFLVSGGLIAVSAVPLLLAADASPTMSGQPSVKFHRLLWMAPTAMFLNGVFAATYMALITFLPIYSQHFGLGEASSLYLLSIMAFGGLAFQLPMGWLADRYNRRLLVIISVLFLIACTAALPFIIVVSIWNDVFIFIFGGVFSSLYTLALILLGERFKGPNLAAASALFTAIWGMGSIIGPPLGGIGMDLWQPQGLILVVVLMFVLYLPFPIRGYLRQRRLGGDGGAETVLSDRL
jgi:MFS family permease